MCQVLPKGRLRRCVTPPIQSVVCKVVDIYIYTHTHTHTNKMYVPIYKHIKHIPTYIHINRENWFDCKIDTLFTSTLEYR